MQRFGALSLLGLVVATLIAACASEDDSTIDTPQGTTTTTAPDAGCDGACDADADAEPDSPPVSTCEAAAEPKTGCPCETPGEQLYCGKVYVKFGEQTVCGPGYMTCDSNSLWGECILNNAAEPPQT